jgi:phosphoribosylanthranilate isomerase
MSLWIKICGNTSLEDALLATRAGADAVGFVFAPSPRQVTPVQVATIVPQLPAEIEKIGVFVDASFEEIEAAVCVGGLTGVQLHFNAAPDLPAKLRERFGPELRVLRVVHFSEETVGEATAILRDPHVHAVLVDSRTATTVGGTGTTFDWLAASKAVFHDANVQQRRLVAAGGLHPDNVAQAIATLRPWGVDVVSGVEATPGRKDPEKVKNFIVRARSAER